jgi:hypothetical protein
MFQGFSVSLNGNFLTSRLGVAKQTNYINVGSFASRASTRGDCLATASEMDWSVCLQTLSRLEILTLFGQAGSGVKVM